MILVGEFQEERIADLGPHARAIKNTALKQSFFALLIFILGLSIGYWWSAQKAAQTILIEQEKTNVTRRN